ncbi:MAG: hypothetical protein AAF633_22790 [Chloroflexota bacterium]
MTLSQVLPSKFAVFLTYCILFLAWLPPEGNIVLVVGFGWITSSIVVIRLLRRWLEPIDFQLRGWVLLWGGGGLAVGAVVPWIILALMALKTGVHAHGPEYTPAEINWVAQQWPFWLSLGGGIGLGYGLLTAGWLGMRAKAQ